MNSVVKAAAPIVAALLLCACGGKEAETPPQSYDLGGASLPSLTAVVAPEEVQFSTSSGEDDTVTYVYANLASGGGTAESYVEALKTEDGCTVATDSETPGEPDFSTESGQALVAKTVEDSEQLLLLTIQWEETSCSVTPSLADQSAMPEADQTVTLERAVEFLANTAPSALGLPGSSMDEYLIYPQEGTVLLDGHPCILMNVYRAADHQLQQSYLLTVPDMAVYRLDRETGQAVLVS